MYTLLKSEVGPYPEPDFPQGIDLEAEDHKARQRLYPVTVVYTLGFFLVLTLAYRSSHLGRALGFAALAVASWTLVEYLVHRYVLHGVFPKGPGLVRRRPAPPSSTRHTPTTTRGPGTGCTSTATSTPSSPPR